MRLLRLSSITAVVPSAGLWMLIPAWGAVLRGRGATAAEPSARNPAGRYSSTNPLVNPFNGN